MPASHFFAECPEEIGRRRLARGKGSFWGIGLVGGARREGAESPLSRIVSASCESFPSGIYEHPSLPLIAAQPWRRARDPRSHARIRPPIAKTGRSIKKCAIFTDALPLMIAKRTEWRFASRASHTRPSVLLAEPAHRSIRIPRHRGKGWQRRPHHAIKRYRCIWALAARGVSGYAAE
jgi:hypothetical protein